MAYDADMALELVKARLNRLASDTSMDDYLRARIEAAAGEMARDGITLDESMMDTMLLVDTVVWQYQSRDKAAGMPNWLRLRRRERWLNGP